MAGGLVWQMMSDLGIKILPQVEARSVLGKQWLESVELSNGHMLSADVCVVAAGIRPNTALAQSAGLRVNRGVIVDDHMRSSNPDIFAAGDVAEYGGQTLGLWPTAAEQARTAVQNLLGKDCVYTGAVPPTRLKVAGIDVLSAGEIAARGEQVREVRIDDGGSRQYRRLVVREGRVRGAVLVGHADLADLVAAAVEAQLNVSHVLSRLERGDWSALAA